MIRGALDSIGGLHRCFIRKDKGGPQGQAIWITAAQPYTPGTMMFPAIPPVPHQSSSSTSTSTPVSPYGPHHPPPFPPPSHTFPHRSATITSQSAPAPTMKVENLNVTSAVETIVSSSNEEAKDAMEIEEKKSGEAENVEGVQTDEQPAHDAGAENDEDADNDDNSSNGSEETPLHEEIPPDSLPPSMRPAAAAAAAAAPKSRKATLRSASPPQKPPSGAKPPRQTTPRPPLPPPASKKTTRQETDQEDSQNASDSEEIIIVPDEQVRQLYDQMSDEPALNKRRKRTIKVSFSNLKSQFFVHSFSFRLNGLMTRNLPGDDHSVSNKHEKRFV